MVGLTVHSRLTGPFFNGQVNRAIRAYSQEVQEAVAQQGISEVHQFLDASIRNPTPYYETQITRERRGGDEIVHDRGIIYGPWLEGVSSRNRTTRFKGYASFRRAAQQLQRKVPQIADRILRQYLPRMN